MQSAKEKNIIIARLEQDEDLFAMIGQLCEHYTVQQGVIMSGIGMLKNFELSYFNPDGYHGQSFATPHELVALHGSIAYASKGNSNELMIHLHAGLAGPDQGLVAGHLQRGTVNVLVELVIMTLEDIRLCRIKNPATDLFELQVEA